MEHFWKTVGIKPDLSSRLDGVGDPENDYKYNSLMVLSTDSDEPPRYVYPRHAAGQWILRMKGLFLTVVSMSRDMSRDPEEVEADKRSDCSRTSDRKSEGGSSRRSGRVTPPAEPEIFRVKLQLHGGPLNCCIGRYPDHIIVVTSDTCDQMAPCIRYLYSTLPHLIPDSHNPILNSAVESTRVCDSYVAPALQMIGTTELVNLPVTLRGQSVSDELRDYLLDLETKTEMLDTICVSCGGLIIVSYPDIIYSSLPPTLYQTILRTLLFRELLTISQGYVIWFNKLYRHCFRVKQQEWYVMTVSKNGMSVSQVLGIFGDPDKGLVIRIARDLEILLDGFSSEIKQHLPCEPIPLKHCQVLGYKYGENRAFYSEVRYKNIVEYHHYLGRVPGAPKYVVNVEEDTFLAQRGIAERVFTVVYNSRGVHDVDTIFRELGI